MYVLLNLALQQILANQQILLQRSKPDYGDNYYGNQATKNSSIVIDELRKQLTAEQRAILDESDRGDSNG